MFEDCLKGKTVVITGASGLIGSAIAAKLGGEGARLILHYNKSEESAVRLANELRVKTYVDLVRYDFSRLDNVLDFIKYLKTRYDVIDVLINSAGVYDDTPLQAVDVDLINKVLNVNLISSMLISKEIGTSMFYSRGGIIVNLICLTPLRGQKVYECLKPSLPYIISKAGLIQLTKYLASELAPKVRVVGIAPGWVGSRKLTPQLVKCVEDSVPAKRAAEPEEIADLVRYLICSGTYINGTVVEFSGGL
ncbi:MAG: SDR family oxidoreductase [Sulfolobales archaeon]